MRVKCLISSFIFPLIIHGQNLVPNPGFEEYRKCPAGVGNLINRGEERSDCLHWYDPTYGSTDYYNRCSERLSTSAVPANFIGWQEPHSGNAYVGMVTYTDSWYELLEVELVSPLEAGKTYTFSFWISKADSLCWATNGLGVYFFKDSLSNDLSDYMNKNPQVKFNEVVKDAVNWTQLQRSFVAEGGEIYMASGVFNPDARTIERVSMPCGFFILDLAYYYIDDVSLVLRSSLNKDLVE